MNKTLLAILAILLLSIPVMADATGTVLPSEATITVTPVATVNGEAISQALFNAIVMPQYLEIAQKISEVNQLFSDILLNTEAGNQLLKVYEQKVLEDLIRKRLIVQYAFINGFEIDRYAVYSQVHEYVLNSLNESDISLKEADTYYMLKGYPDGLFSYELKTVEDIVFKNAFNALFNAITADASSVVTDEMIQEYYSANPDEFSIKGEFVELYEERFDSFTKAYSFLQKLKSVSDPTLEFSSGSVKYGRDDVVSINPELVSKLFDNFQPGLMNSIEKTNDGKYIIFYLVDYTQEGTAVKPLETVREDIKAKLLEETKRLLWNQWLEGDFKTFYESSTIEISEEFK
ncbi:hypothetical protein AT15_04765 [Kosmotoga arenicorallina S304]|uniref:PpiC domain-containing protein n=1 Tax=Kosmotoga arenicorallina S304 TaxID=1453497 RepID=A0A176JWE5_9BACT|nr:SurA N-terminal domain-containing protein [Kosmotoga arenicorallina]OAA28002.1 hypothetical protein AT15_04765 [Kosmotoga arenicorallina S304]